jgi:hypothetical protein
VFIIIVVAIITLQGAFWALQTLLAWGKIGMQPVISLAPRLVINSSTYFSYFILMLVFLFTFLVAHKIAKQKLGFRQIIPVASIFIYYGLVVSLVWLISLFKEINASDYRW